MKYSCGCKGLFIGDPDHTLLDKNAWCREHGLVKVTEL